MELTPKKIAIHLGLFVVTFVTTTMAGAEWVYSKSIFQPDYSWSDFASGMPYSIPFLLILTAHEFGHYFTAVYYKVRTTLPYYIPLPSIPLLLPLTFGTLGALIRLKTRVPSRQQNFDIGIAGPLAGFVVAFAVLWYGFATLPPPEYIFEFHPSYQQYGPAYADFVYLPGNLPQGTIDIVIGKNLLFLFFEKFVADPARVPNAHEIIHYPYLFAGFLSLVFTSINLLPIGQLDGGHVIYGLLGFRGHKWVASACFIALLFYAGWGVVLPGQSFYIFGEIPYPLTIPVFIGFLYWCLARLGWTWQNRLMAAVAIFAAQYFLTMLAPGVRGYPGWLLFVVLIGRFIGIHHPPSEIEAPLTEDRKIVGWIGLFVFVICFAPVPIDMSMVTAPEP